MTPAASAPLGRSSRRDRGDDERYDKVEGARRDEFGGAMLGTLVGDCLGAPYEGRSTVGAAAAARRIARALERGKLRYTDDTQLTLAIAEHLVDDPEIAPHRLVQRMLDRYEDDRGYGAGMRRLVMQWRRGVDFDAAATAVFPDGSFGNGAAMRVAPIGVRWAEDAETVAAVATRSARVTHVHPIGVDGAVVQASAVAVAATGGAFTLDHLGELRANTVELRAGLATAARLPRGATPLQVVRQLGNDVTAHRSVPVALWCAATADDIESCVTRAVALGGDTDTIAAMAAAVRGAADGPAGIPPAWAEACEGFDTVRAVAATLADRCGASDGRDATRGGQ